jgi:hypothetical protein
MQDVIACEWDRFRAALQHACSLTTGKWEWVDCSDMSVSEFTAFLSANDNTVTVRYPKHVVDDHHWSCLWCEYIMNSTLEDPAKPAPIVDAYEFLTTVFVTNPFASRERAAIAISVGTFARDIENTLFGNNVPEALPPVFRLRPETHESLRENGLAKTLLELCLLGQTHTEEDPEGDSATCGYVQRTVFPVVPNLGKCCRCCQGHLDLRFV